MKKSNLVLLIAFFFLPFSITNGQIKVDTDGDVTIGATTAATEDLDVVGDTYFNGHVGIGGSPSTTKELKVTGGIQVTGSSSITTLSTTTTSATYLYSGNYSTGGGAGNIITETGYYTYNLVPTYNNSSSLGTSSKAFAEVHAYDYPVHQADIREKENIRDLEGALGKITKLRGIQYDLKPDVVVDPEYRVLIDDEEFVTKKIEKAKNQIGLIAQEVEEIIPSIVRYNDSTDTYAISYTRLIPVLIEAIKEQQVLIEDMQIEIDGMESTYQKSLLSGIEKFGLADNCALYQNAPNPFGETTSIRYSLPEGTTNAVILIYDMTGKQLKRFPLTENGEANIEVSGGEMDPGMYMYSMIVENQLVDTKQMVITE